ncbi:Uncharacterised protein [Zhongshania aliphaticivorans]|uniref:Peptidase M10 metallopeptidase domain-containing protein n=1 Tax=Zhongshania aliphaticivorans TaxID=1470434 RepID=A0A5S9PXN2_9GAMM|nr:hypothetical protein [Zhongshania aliphaticivorans]CAA0109860.1 Uncharacterised protein [Zhongshania aliphaticivorans]CAA0117928.1 Uncharacterised protein [Zhongshania aliphaticivorans]CAA0121703.1 Uncharacterised protein [Zhongshania aliphaticivorans]
MKRIFCSLMLPLAVALAGCGGGGGGGSSLPVVDEAGILDNLKITNLNYSNPYASRTSSWGWDTNPVCDDPAKKENGTVYGDPDCPYREPPRSDQWEDTTIDRLKKWDIAGEGLIPVKHNDSQYGIHAMDTIEEKVGMTLFDRNSILNVADEDIERGIIISEGTATGGFNQPAGFACGNVHPYDQPYNVRYEWYDEHGVIFGPLMLHIGSDDPHGCTNGANLYDIAVHEMMHALGLGTHFEGFGIGPMFDDNAWNVLHNILTNQQNANEFELVIEKRFPEE